MRPQPHQIKEFQENRSYPYSMIFAKTEFAENAKIAVDHLCKNKSSFNQPVPHSELSEDFLEHYCEQGIDGMFRLRPDFIECSLTIHRDADGDESFVQFLDRKKFDELRSFGVPYGYMEIQKPFSVRR